MERAALKPSTRLRQRLAQPGALIVPGAFDCVSARLVELAGFPAVLHGGFNAGASAYGIPDVGLITLTETLAVAHHMARAVAIPVLADLDDGFGGLLNVDRAARLAIAAGVAGVYCDDQVAPRRCPALGGGAVIPPARMLQKLRALDRARRELDPDFLVIARTHAGRAVNLAEAITRGIAYARAGADLIWVDLGYDESVRTELREIGERIAPHAPVVANMTENVGRPLLTRAELEALGFKLVVYPLTLLMAAAGAMQRTLAELRVQGTTLAVAEQLMTVASFQEILRLPQVEQRERWLEGLAE
jgi:2-methylisocitrate lyase-like PEP mutase family enzyme